MDNEIFKAFLLQALTEYETDCYNDSTYITVSLFTEQPSNNISYVRYGYYTNTKIWEHKQPTFPDFIKWLHTKTEN